MYNMHTSMCVCVRKWDIPAMAFLAGKMKKKPLHNTQICMNIYIQYVYIYIYIIYIYIHLLTIFSHY